MAVSGWKWLLKVSGQSRTSRASPAAATPRAARNHASNVCAAKRGMLALAARCRRRAWPARRAAGALREGLTSRGPATRAAPTSRSAPSRRRARPQPPRVVVRQELGLVGRHVDVDRTVALAALARRGTGRAPPYRSLRQPSSIASPCSISKSRRARPRVECFSSWVDHVARAHRAAARAPALADADAAQRRRAKLAAVLGEAEVRLEASGGR